MTAKKRGQSPRRAATPVPTAIEGEGGREKDVIGSYCTGTKPSLVLGDREKRESCGEAKLYKTWLTRHSIISTTNIQTGAVATS
ncbi:hypothetical protein K0M31_011061 [Melipona bicolor]|uniref:Uncharacterized protein n=1 Tax=Melipona bicolor TaxID=60889 RepID=A0AA40FKP3_9HYME|nr:hypothetical protein K0M31_011061 [Melipona bicolor]